MILVYFSQSYSTYSGRALTNVAQKCNYRNERVQLVIIFFVH